MPVVPYVITQEDIRQSGVTSIPGALRRAPRVDVARIDPKKWAIGVRDFTSRLSRSLLVLSAGADLRAVVYHQTGWDRAGALHCTGECASARGVDHGGEHAGAWHDLHRDAAAP